MSLFFIFNVFSSFSLNCRNFGSKRMKTNQFSHDEQFAAFYLKLGDRERWTVKATIVKLLYSHESWITNALTIIQHSTAQRNRALQRWNKTAIYKSLTQNSQCHFQWVKESIESLAVPSAESTIDLTTNKQTANILVYISLRIDDTILMTLFRLCVS